MNDLVEPEALEAASLDWASELAGNAPLSVRGNKQVFRALLAAAGRGRRGDRARADRAARGLLLLRRHARGRARVRREARRRAGRAGSGGGRARLHLERQLAARPAPARARDAREARAGRRRCCRRRRSRPTSTRTRSCRPPATSPSITAAGSGRASRSSRARASASAARVAGLPGEIRGDEARWIEADVPGLGAARRERLRRQRPRGRQRDVRREAHVPRRDGACAPASSRARR